MLKHIAGFVIFSFIVGTSVLIGNLFTPLPATSAVQVSDSGARIERKKRKRCHKKRPQKQTDSAGLETAGVFITRAVFYKRIGQLKTELAVNDNGLRPVDVALHFYVSDKYGTRYLTTEFASVEAESSGPETLTFSFSWLDRLASQENLFIMAEVAGDRQSYEGIAPAFDRQKATPIGLGGFGTGVGTGSVKSSEGSRS